MEVQISDVGAYRLIHLARRTRFADTLPEIMEMAEAAFSQGIVNIAVRFADESYLCSAAVSTLILVFEETRDRGGEFAIVRPNGSIRHLLTVIDLDRIIRIVDSPDELTTAPCA